MITYLVSMRGRTTALTCAKHLKNLRAALSLLLAIALGLAGCEAPAPIKRPPETVGPKVYEVRFARAIHEARSGEGSVTSISISEPSVYVYAKWQGFTTNEQYIVNVRIFDDAGTYIRGFSFKTTPTSRTWNTWFRFNVPTRTIDEQPVRLGRWRFDFYLDQHLGGSGVLTVTAN